VFLLLSLVMRPTAAREVGGLLLVLAALGSVMWVAAVAAALVRRLGVARHCWMDVEDRLEHRHAVIGSLVEVVRAATAHERAAVDNVVTARSRAIQAAGSPVAVRARAERTLDDVVSRLLSAVLVGRLAVGWEVAAGRRS
jgi:LemA protein